MKGSNTATQRSSEHSKAEVALRQSEERFRILVESVKDYAIFALDPQGIVISWNAGAENIKGYKAHEIIGKHFSTFYTREALVTGWPDEELRRATAEGRFQDEGWRVRKDGTTFWANVIITALFDDAGTLIGFAKITQNLTERRQLEIARSHAATLADLSRRKDEFLAMLSHELRNPLAPILNSVQLLRATPLSNPVQEQAVSIIGRQVTQLTHLIDDLLEISRIVTGRLRLEPSKGDFRQIVRRSADSVRTEAARRNIQLSISVPEHPVWITADGARIEQVIVNLLSNAIKYNNENGQIWLTLAQHGNEGVLSVRDNGVGVHGDLLPHVFDLFTQADRSLDRSQGGLGIGLSIVQRIVELHHGRVEASSGGIGKGSDFIVRLPLQSPEVDPIPAEELIFVNSSKNNFRVLVVDDNQDAADTASMLLRYLGHDVRTEYLGSSALKTVDEFRPEVVVLDIGLPEMDGYEVARRIRERYPAGTIHLIALSGYGQESDRQRSQAAGFDAHLVKPVELERLQEIFETVVHSPADLSVQHPIP